MVIILNNMYCFEAYEIYISLKDLNLRNNWDFTQLLHTKVAYLLCYLPSYN